MTDSLKEYPRVDEHGKRYRIFGRGCREYAPKIVTSGGEFLVGAVTYRKPELETIEQRKTCPFKGGMQPHLSLIHLFLLLAANLLLGVEKFGAKNWMQFGGCLLYTS